MTRRRAGGRRRRSAQPGTVTIVVDGRAVETLEGRSLASALHAAGILALRRNLVTGEARAPFCGMGVCFECEVSVDGRREVRACMTDVHDGLVVETGRAGEGGAG